LSVAELISAFGRLSTTNVSDALDKMSLRGTAIGILPKFQCNKIIGRAVTLKVTAAGLTSSGRHLGVDAIESSHQGDIIVIDNGGRQDVSCWGEILSVGSKSKGVAGVVIDGAFRDLDAIRLLGFPVYARAVVPLTARGRVMQEASNVIIQCGGVQVRPQDIVMADDNGVVIVPTEKAREVLTTATEFYEKECEMIKDIQRGISISDVDKKYRYEEMTRH